MKIFNHFQNINLTNDQRNTLEMLQAFLESNEEVFILQGYAGSGKTTLLTLIGALRTCQSGDLKVLNHQLNGASRKTRQRLRRSIGMIFQGHNLLRCLTSEQNVQMGADLIGGLTYLQRREIARGLEESVDVLNNVGINSQEASALIVVTQHYDTLQSIGEETNSNLILLPNSPQAGSDMLNNMVASFTASNQIGEAMKKENLKSAAKKKVNKNNDEDNKGEGDSNVNAQID